MNIADIYEAARTRGLTHSKRHFSRAILGRAPNYLADRAFSGCSAAVLLNLYKRLGELGQVDLQAAAFARLLRAEGKIDGAPEMKL
ncbi:hypothetical protein JMJ55_04300 [Belnapia sp. T6]|uniref:Uncharacterized protein n=1 Tax=Belnapia mucosa TaxID=2804532 RepID=A0ABS1UYJ9_9PROT|nr:hypothetical protein [Belnapia mucosa]MBL6454533.1 hypothetical protein [Belnapia mucosa]